MRSETFDLVVSDHHLRVRRLSIGAPANGPALVFLHDSLGSIATWRDFPDRVATRLQLDAVVFDRRGYGESSHFPPLPRTPRYLEDEAESLGATLAALGISSAVLVGHSDGGSIALIAGALYPDVVRGIVTEGAHVFVEDVTLAGIRAARETLRTTDLRARLMRYHGDRTDAVTTAWIDTWLAPEYRDWNIESNLPRVACPVLVIQGTADEYGTEAQVQAIVNGVSGPAEALMIPGVGHTPHREAADVVLDAIVAFVRTEIPGARPEPFDGRDESAA